MSKYNPVNNPLILMKIVIDERQETINVPKISFDKFFKISNEWDNVYDLTIENSDTELTDDDFINLCNQIGDMITDDSIEDINENVFIYLAKFIDKYAVPNAANRVTILKIIEFISEFGLRLEINTNVDIFPNIEMEYVNAGKSLPKGSSRCPPLGIILGGDYIPEGNLRDAYVIYRLLSSGCNDELAHIKWFRSFSVLFKYFEMDQIVKIVRSNSSEKLRKKRRCVPKLVSDSEEEDEVPAKKIPVKVTKKNDCSSDDSDDFPTESKIRSTYVPSDAECPVIRDGMEDDYLVLIVDRVTSKNDKVFSLLSALLKNHMRNIALPERENLIININNLGDYL